MEITKKHYIPTWVHLRRIPRTDDSELKPTWCCQSEIIIQTMNYSAAVNRLELYIGCNCYQNTFLKKIIVDEFSVEGILGIKT